MAKIAGHYTATWNGSSIGSTATGFALHETHHKEDVHSDDYGDAPIDGIQQGTECEITLDFIDYDLILAAEYAQNTQGSANPNVGHTLTSLAQALVLTPVAGTPAASLVWTFTKAIVISDIETLLSAKLRQGPCRFKCYPVAGVTYTRA